MNFLWNKIPVGNEGSKYILAPQWDTSLCMTRTGAFGPASSAEEAAKHISLQPCIPDHSKQEWLFESV